MKLVLQGLPLAIVVASIFAGAGARAAAPELSVSLLDGSLNRHVLLGKSVAGVTAALGKPTWRIRGASDYRLIYGDRRDFRIMVHFRERAGDLRAVSVAFERAPVFESKLGINILSLPPRYFASKALAAYKGSLTVTRPARCLRGTCSVTLHVVGTDRSVTYGRTSTLGPYLTIWKPS